MTYAQFCEVLTTEAEVMRSEQRRIELGQMMGLLPTDVLARANFIATHFEIGWAQELLSAELARRVVLDTAPRIEAGPCCDCGKTEAFCRCS